jgi:hypothetical protein
LTRPFENILKTPFDELIDILLSLPGCLALSETILNQVGQNLSGIKSTLHRDVLELIYRLGYWRQRYCSDIIEPNGHGRAFFDLSANRKLDTSDLRFYPPQIRAYDNIWSAVFIAMYDAANLIAFSLLLLVSPSTDKDNYRIQFYAQSVLLADAFIEFNCSPGPSGASLLMMFPLKILGLWGPLPQQRDYATRKLHRWDQGRG